MPFNRGFFFSNLNFCRDHKVAKCNICNKRWFFSSQVKCDCKAKQLKARATHFNTVPQPDIKRTGSGNSSSNLSSGYMHQQNTMLLASALNDDQPTRGHSDNCYSSGTSSNHYSSGYGGSSGYDGGSSSCDSSSSSSSSSCD